MIKCIICNCQCDPSDLINYVCDDCRAERKRVEQRQERMKRLLTADGFQLRLEDFIT